jgi:hypothetical protein
LKLLVRFEVTTGQFQALERGAARDSERTLVRRLPAVSPGTLHLADLGFFDYDELAQITQQGARGSAACRRCWTKNPTTVPSRV